ncbi:MAG: hypothetical protein ACXVDH_00330 [Nocardioides sp.]
MPELPHLPAAAHQATDQAKELARKGAHAATALLDASFHPFRTVRSMVQTEEPIPPPPTDAQPDPVADPEPPQAPTPRIPADVQPPDLPVVPTGPAPHMPPDIADEIEREYGEDLPGFRNGDEPPGTH